MSDSCDKNIPEYIVLPSSGAGTPGPQGPPGPKGDSGIATLPIPATEVTVTNIPYKTVQEVIDFLLYIALVVSNFRPSTSTYEIGQNITSSRFTWAYNKASIVSQLFKGNGPDVSVPIAARELSVSFSPALSATKTFTLTTDDGTNVINTKTNIQFLNGVYFGDKIVPAGFTSSFIRTLNKKLQGNKNSTFTSQASGLEYAWFAHPKRYGIASFSAGGFTGGFQAPVEVAFTNQYGYTEPYYIYQSDNPNIGPVNIITT